MVTVLCIKWGDRYGPEYVNNLYGMVSRNLAIPHRVVCLTDDRQGIRAEVVCRPLPAINLSGISGYNVWRKVSVFSPELDDLEPPVLFLDLDLIIIDRIDCFFDHTGEFCIIENWTQPGRGIGNSSVFRFRPGQHRALLERFNAQPAEARRRYGNSQTYVSRNVDQLTFWPRTWCRSFKHECLPIRPLRRFVPARIPPGAKILVFHGHPKPPDAARGVWPERFKGLRPVPWIQDYWC